MLVRAMLFASLSLSLLANCTSTQSENIRIQPEVIERDIILRPRPRELSLSDVQFFVVTGENFEQFIRSIENDDGTYVFIAITVNGYERLSLNFADIRRYIAQQNEIIVYYEQSLS